VNAVGKRLQIDLFRHSRWFHAGRGDLALSPRNEGDPRCKP
jgi:hypothetical protein